MHKTIRISLSQASITQAIQELEQFKSLLEAKTKALNERLANIALAEAESCFSGAMYDGDNDVRLTAEPTNTGWRITAQGRAVFFIEFGAGVHYNGDGGAYPEERPQGIVGIGQYGKGLGKNDSWRYKASNGVVVKTHGNPAAMPMFKGREAVIAAINDVVREVFG